MTAMTETIDPQAPLAAPGLALEPLVPAHAEAMFALLSDPALYEWLDHGPPASAEHLRSVYARLQSRASPDGGQAWFNWALRLADADGASSAGGALIGYVQATVMRASRTAWVAWVLGRAWQGRGHARAAVAAMLAHLADAQGCTQFLACIEADHRRSIALAEALGFVPAPADHPACAGLTASERLLVRDATPAPRA